MKIKQSTTLKQEAKETVIDWLKRRTYLFWTIPVKLLFKASSIDDALKEGWIHTYAEPLDIIEGAICRLQDIEEDLSPSYRKLIQAINEFNEQRARSQDFNSYWLLTHPAISMFYLEIMEYFLDRANMAESGTELDYFEDDLFTEEGKEILTAILDNIIAKYVNDYYFDNI